MAARFNGTSDYLKLPSIAVATAAPITLMAWGRINGGSASFRQMVNICDSTNGNHYFLLYVRTNELVSYQIGQSTGVDVEVDSPTTARKGEWFHAAGVSTLAPTHALYVNGSKVASSTSANGVPTGLNTTNIGAENAGGSYQQFWNGDLAWVSIHNVALTDGEIRAASAGAPPWLIRPAALVACVPLEMSPLVDTCGRIWTPVGAPKIVESPRLLLPVYALQPWKAKRRVRGPLAYSLPVGPGNFSLAGKSVGLTIGYPFAPAPGTFTLTGEAAGLVKASTLGAAAGAFVLSGEAAGLDKGYALAPASGSFALTGENAGFPRSYAVKAQFGAFTLSGEAAALEATRTLPAGPGSFTLTGENTDFEHGFAMPAQSGSFALTGESVSLLRTALTVAAPGMFTLTGENAGLVRGARLIASPGQFALTGEAATLARTALIRLGTGTYQLTGEAAALAHAAHVVADPGIFALTGQDAGLTLALVPFSVAAGSFVITGQNAWYVIARFFHTIQESRYVAFVPRRRIAAPRRQRVASPTKNRTAED